MELIPAFKSKKSLKITYTSNVNRNNRHRRNRRCDSKKMVAAGHYVDAEAKRIIVGLVNDAGFDAVDSGDLSESWKHQPGTPAHCTELNEEELKQALSDGIKEQAPAIREKAIQMSTDLIIDVSKYQKYPPILHTGKPAFVPYYPVQIELQMFDIGHSIN
ncbi:hypothetical protein LXM25_26285 [Dyadobacter sp. LJ53]|uniref:hypothetical protein n=1 Tax=Dyadobacter chenwenxiniae TaxID=2906456 RepID=UPI001F182759|nr:hypothetical protein [Dyadobacter chenwenxiniae]MCF0053609.1 hypothetical protein [Dyadobacter chenwenxiniae]